MFNLRKLGLWGAPAVLLFFLILISYSSSSAIPAFARKYRTACTTCHIAVPKRNAFGEAFRRNGYVLPRMDRLQTKEEPIELGVEGWKEVFPNTIWPGLLPEHFPVSAYILQRITMNPARADEVTNIDFDTPHELELFFGGSFDQTFSFFGEYILYDDGTAETEVNKLFLQINDLIGRENLVNIRIGRLEPGISDGYLDDQRITIDHTPVHDFKATGQWRMKDIQQGIEINGILLHRYYYALGIVNGDTKKPENTSDEKDIYSRLAVKLFGKKLDQINNRKIDTQNKESYWVDNSISLGIFTYQGNDYREEESVVINGIDTAIINNLIQNRFQRYGGDINFSFNKSNLLAGLIYGIDKDPMFGVLNEEIKSTAWYTELQQLYYPWLISALRVGGMNSKGEQLKIIDQMTAVMNLTALARQNVRLTLELKAVKDKLNYTDENGISAGTNDWEISSVIFNILFAF